MSTQTSPPTTALLIQARNRVLQRTAATAAQVTDGVPHWADTATGTWTTTPDGDWTGGAWLGQLWLGHAVDPTTFPVEGIHRWLERIAPRHDKRTAFKGFTFYYGGALGSILFGDDQGRSHALRAAQALTDMFDPQLGLIPLGADAEEFSATGDAESSIDSLQASPLLLWAAPYLGATAAHVAAEHTTHVLANHVRDDGSVVQSTTLDPANGTVLRSHTHKGYNDSSTWGRAQAWAMLYSAICAEQMPHRADWLQYARRTSDWWLSNVPDDGVAFWDFDDPAIPDTDRDTAATAIAAAGMLKLAALLGSDGEKYQRNAEYAIHAMANDYLGDGSGGVADGLLSGGCFTRRDGARTQDRTTSAELVFGTYFFLESLCRLTGTLPDCAI